MRSAHYGRFQTEIRKNMRETAELRCDRPVKGRPHLLGRVITRPRPQAVLVRNCRGPWLVGLIGGVGGSLINLLLIVALIILLYNLFVGARPV